MSSTTRGRSAREQSVMNSPIITSITRLIVSREINSPTFREEVFKFAESTTNIDSIKDALFYLEHADWNPSQASTQRDLDRIDRAGPELDSDGEAVDSNATNQRINRSMVKPGDDYDPSMTKIKLRYKGKMRTFTYPHVKTLDHTNQADINHLNRWRHSILRKHIGIAQSSLRTGTDFHPLEQAFLLNRYAEQEIDDRGHCKYEEITQDHNRLFQHEFLPARAEPCEARTRDSISGFLTRKAINPREVGRRWPTHFNAVMRHAAAQERIKEEWQERVKGNNNADSVEDEEQEGVCEADEVDQTKITPANEKSGSEDDMALDNTAITSDEDVGQQDGPDPASASGSEYQDDLTDDEDD